MSEPNTYVVTRETRVQAPPERILERIVDFRRWQAWSPWEGLDPDLRRTYSGPEARPGSTYEWDGNRKAGKGRMQITDVSPEKVTVDLVFEKPFKSQSTTVFTVRPDAGGSIVTWTMTGQKTLMTRVMGIFKSMDSLIGPDFEKGLELLKVDAEAAA